MTTKTQAPDPAPLSATVAAALRRAFNLGQTYWQQADSDSYSQNAKAHITHGKFIELLEETTAAVDAIPAPEGDVREAAQKALDALLDTEATGAPPLFLQSVIDTLRAALAAPAPQEPTTPEGEPLGAHLLRLARKHDLSSDFQAAIRQAAELLTKEPTNDR